MTTADFTALITNMTQAACRGDGAGVMACFTADGVYHDVFYGSFQGPEIVGMIEGHFHRDGQDFRWELFDPISDGRVGYVRYVFSYTSRLSGCIGQRAIFEGVAICRVADGLISDYREVAEASTGLSMIGFSDTRMAKFVAKQARALADRKEAKAHRKS